MTCAELYHCNPTFAAAINAWVAERRCPLALGDFLEELDMHAPAACARWAATEVDRPVYHGSITGEVCGPFPDRGDGGWYWVRGGPQYLHESSGCILNKQIPKNIEQPTAKTPAHAILWLLDNWVAAS